MKQGYLTVLQQQDDQRIDHDQVPKGLQTEKEYQWAKTEQEMVQAEMENDCHELLEGLEEVQTKNDSHEEVQQKAQMKKVCHWPPRQGIAQIQMVEQRYFISEAADYPNF